MALEALLTEYGVEPVEEGEVREEGSAHGLALASGLREGG